MIPKYIRLKDKLSEEISLKKYPLYSKLPTEVELAEEYHVSRATVRQALALLEEDGIINKHWGSGNTVIGTYSASQKNTVAFIIPELSYPFLSDTIEDLKSSLYKEDLSLEVVLTNGHQSRERLVLDQIFKEVYAGYIILPSSFGLPSMNTDIYQKLLRRQLPLLFLFTCPSDLIGTSVFRTDEYECGYMCARYLINKGHKSIGAIFRCNNILSTGRFSGFICALRDSNIAVDEDLIFWLSPDQSPYDLDLFLEKAKGHMSGLVCDSELISETVYDMCLQNSVTIPDDLAIICCENTPENKTGHMPFSCACPTRSLGKEIASSFLSIKKDGSVQNTTIGYKLIGRKSS